MISGFSHIAKQRIAGSVDMVRNRVFCNRYILYTTCSTGRFCKVDRLTFPEHVMLTFFDLLYVRFEFFVVANANTLFILFVSFYFAEFVIFTKSSLRAAFN